MKPKSLVFPAVLTLSLTMGLAGCAGLKPVETPTQLPTTTPYPTQVPTPVSTVSQGDVLPFETIERRTWPGSGREWTAKEPGLVVVTTSDDLVQINHLFTEDAQARLREVDFSACFVVVVFLGKQGGHEGIQIERVVRQDDVVLFYVWVGNPTGNMETTSPYHLVQVRKEGNWDQTIHFKLHTDGTVTTSMKTQGG